MAIGWIGTGRMGAAMVRRLAVAGVEVVAWNRTRAKAEALRADVAADSNTDTNADANVTVADRIAELAECEVVFSSVFGSADLEEVITGPDGLLSRTDAAPAVVVDTSTVSVESSAAVREAAAARGAAFLAAPVSGNPQVVAAGRLGFAVSGPEDAFWRVRPLLDAIGGSVTYIGDGDGARLVKLCNNLFLGAVTQSLAEILVLAEKGGVSRAALLGFLNDTALGSNFIRSKTSALVELDYSPTFTPALLRKDFDLGLDAARELSVPMPVAALVQQFVQGAISGGRGDEDIAVLLDQQAAGAGLVLKPENAEVDDGAAG